VDGREVVGASRVALATDRACESKTRVKRTSRSSADNMLYPVVRQKSASVEDRYNGLRIDLSDGTSIEWRAYDDGIAWRWLTSIEGDYTITGERADFALGGDTSIWYPAEKSFYSGCEPTYTLCTLDELGPGKLASLPVLFDSGGTKLLVTESNLLDYAGMWLESGREGTIGAVFPYYPKEKEKRGDRDEYVLSREDYIAKYSAPADFPWRVVAIAREDGELLSNTLVYRLADPSGGDFSWVRPGKAQWDWWNDSNIYKVDFEAGMNTRTYKYFIDFAAANGLGYVVIDEGWSQRDDIMKTNPDMDIPGLVRYAKGKGVDIVLWCTWLRLDEKMTEALDTFAGWGVGAIKVDFMSRDDQQMVGFYRRVSEEAARRRILVDFHGCYKPTGLYRTYPNVVTYEGVYGLEQSKGDATKSIGPDHNVVIPFTRMVAGPMDYTPGAMLNAHKEQWFPSYSEPASIGTRCHQLAMYVVYESPLQMLCDSPTKYEAEPECMEFLRAVPTVWDRTVPLDCRVGEYVAVARQAAGGEWFVGAMTGSGPRSLEIALDFLDEGATYTVTIWQDGANANKNAKDFAVVKRTVDSSSRLKTDMVRGGGFAAIISKTTER
jgi:alpha-glucosidase